MSGKITRVTLGMLINEKKRLNVEGVERVWRISANWAIGVKRSLGRDWSCLTCSKKLLVCIGREEGESCLS